MPQREEKWKTLFADLGRPTLRGIRKCPKCGTVNGTRGNSCKNKSCDVIFRGNGPRKKPSTEACLISNIPGSIQKIYSVRLRDRGPDYRNFVQLPINGESDIGIEGSDIPSHVSEAKCFVDVCNRNKQQFPCSHILAAQRCFSDSQTIIVKHSVLAALNIPAEYIDMLTHLINELPHLMVQRVSKTSFVVNCQPSPRHPLGFLHIMFIKPPKDDGKIEKTFLCNCRPFKVLGREVDGDRSNSLESKICIHYYACICAFASNETLTTEFEYIISKTAQEYSPPLLSQLHLVTLSKTSTEKSHESLDPNNISVEIMRDNISLLESIAAADDSTLANGLEGVLSDQIIVTNADDSLTFGDPAVLDGLDDTDQQVCQIFSNAQNTIQLATFANASENQLNQQHVLDIQTTEPRNLKHDEERVEHRNLIKRKKYNHNAGSVEFSQSQSSGSSYLNGVTASLRLGQLQNPVTYTRAAISSVESNVSCDSGPMTPGFNQWLAGVNDRINATMNYLLSPQPEPLVYFIPSEYFECLKDRITAVGKKRRLPNSTIVFNRTDKAPLGTFTKHVWKLTSIQHIMHIFDCSLVMLKTKQYFSKTNNGKFIEWIPPNNEDEKNQRILPVLHSTYLKCGRDPESRTKESIPFVIEWIPEIFRDSKLGELTLHFEFGRTGPIHEGDNNINISGFLRGEIVVFLHVTLYKDMF